MEHMMGLTVQGYLRQGFESQLGAFQLASSDQSELSHRLQQDSPALVLSGNVHRGETLCIGEIGLGTTYQQHRGNFQVAMGSGLPQG